MFRRKKRVEGCAKRAELARTTAPVQSLSRGWYMSNTARRKKERKKHQVLPRKQEERAEDSTLLVHPQRDRAGAQENEKGGFTLCSGPSTVWYDTIGLTWLEQLADGHVRCRRQVSRKTFNCQSVISIIARYNHKYDVISTIFEISSFAH